MLNSERVETANNLRGGTALAIYTSTTEAEEMRPMICPKKEKVRSSFTSNRWVQNPLKLRPRVFRWHEYS